VQKAIDIMSEEELARLISFYEQTKVLLGGIISLEEELARLISFYEQTKVLLGGIISLEDLPVDKNQEFRWRFDLGQPLVRPELVNKLPTKMCRFHDWYLKKSAEGLEMFGILVRPGDFALQNEKVVWLQFIGINEIYHLDTVNTDLMMAWCP
jgi:hypothetical protein